MTVRITPVILSGGSGTRLWPLSREATPKQLLSLVADQTMLQLTAARVMDSARFDPAIIVAKEAHRETIIEQMAAIGAPVRRMILEPVARNTAAAIALASLVAQPDDLLLVLPSDHVIQDSAAFAEAIARAAPLAAQDWLVTFGITPNKPETGYGYIERGEAIAADCFRAIKFVEKPDAETAKTYVEGGRHDWNGGIFLFRAGAMLNAFEAHAPDILGGARNALDAADKTDGGVTPNPDAFGKVRSQSIDHAIMEHADRIAVVPVEMGWSDLGSWDALYDLLDGDADDNVSSGDVLAIDSKGCMLRSSGRLIVAVGVDDLLVIETGDSVLILPRGESQRVKDAVEALKAKRHSSLEH